MGTATNVEHIAKARKTHGCSWCGERIEIDQPYSRWRWFDGGDASTVRVHPECNAALHDMSVELGESIEFFPGENPRGCYCGFDPACPKCRKPPADEVKG